MVEVWTVVSVNRRQCEPSSVWMGRCEPSSVWTVVGVNCRRCEPSSVWMGRCEPSRCEPSRCEPSPYLFWTATEAIVGVVKIRVDCKMNKAISILSCITLLVFKNVFARPFNNCCNIWYLSCCDGISCTLLHCSVLVCLCLSVKI